MEIAERSETYLDNKANLDNYKDQEEYEKRMKKNHDFVQFSRYGIEALLKVENVIAHKVFYFFAKEMDRTNALIINQSVLAEILGFSRQSISTSIKDLINQKLITTVKSGSSVIYCINARVVWTQERDKLHLARFNASVIVSKEEQKAKIVKDKCPKIVKDTPKIIDADLPC